MPEKNSSRKPRILLLSAYDAGSHRRWREQLVASQPEFEWHVLTLPPRFFRWRIRGNALTWLTEPLLQESWDLLLVTSMVDLASIRGFHPHLANTPSLLYMHENQFAFPESEGQHASIDPQMVNLFSAIAARQVLFNSDWNRRSFLDGVERLFRKLPDGVPGGTLEQLAEKSGVLPVPIEDRLFLDRGGPSQGQCSHLLWNQRWECETGGSPLKIIWASRWEYDKGPKHLLAFLKELEARQVNFRLCLLGERFRTQPPEFDVIEKDFSRRLVQFGYAQSRDEYIDWLGSADIVVSTALHEFQGIAVLEAVACGCIPLLPDRLSYPEIFGKQFLFPSNPGDPDGEARGAVDKLQEIQESLENNSIKLPDVSDFSASSLRQRYQNILMSLPSQGIW